MSSNTTTAAAAASGAAANTVTASQLDFESLLSRGYRPANVTRLIPRDKYQPEKDVDKKKRKEKNQRHANKSNINNSITTTNGGAVGSGGTSSAIHSNNNSYYNMKLDSNEAEMKRIQEDETSRLVLKLVSQTQAFRRHLPDDATNKNTNSATTDTYLQQLRGPSPPKMKHITELIENDIPPIYHEIELGDWESQINWKGCADATVVSSDNDDDDDSNDDNNNSNNKWSKMYSRITESLPSLDDGDDDHNNKRIAAILPKVNPMELLERPRNPFLDTLVFDSTTVSWTGDTDDLIEKSNNAPLILELGVAGRSVGRHVYQNTVLSAQRPTPALRSDAYRQRVEREWAKQPAAIMNPEDVANKGSLHLDKEKMQALIEARQKKRAQMAEDKKDRVADAMGTMALGGGRGRTVTSSLMGPGGTERTGRPSRNMAVGGAHETVYIEQLDMGGGDRPARRKRGGEAQEASQLSSRNNDRLPRLEGPNRKTTVTDWIGKLPKKTQKDRSEKEIIDVLPEGVTEMLHPKVHGPFIGEIEQGTTLTGLISNLFVAPLFKHEPESTDFLMILSPIGGASRPGQREAMGVILRDLPESVFTVGQTEPRVRVHAPNTQGEKSFIGPFVSYQIACVLRRSQEKDGHGLRFDELQDRVLPSSDLPPNALRQRLKQVAIYDKNTQIWTTKQIGFEDYPGVDALAKSISPEGVAAFESACAARRRFVDLGVQQLLEKGSHTVASIGVTMVYLVGQLNFASDCYRKTKRLRDLSKSTVNKGKSMSLQIKFYEKATEELEELYKVFRQKHEVAQFVYEELQLAPWHLTGEFIDVHKKSEGTGMMKLTGLGDPSGQGEGFSFLREVDSKPSKSVGNSALNAEIKKITGTDDDLRKLTMKQMAALLRSYGMGQKQIDTLKRWDRVHVIRDLSTKAACDGIAGEFERFARGEKMKLSEQKQVYTERIQVIWKRQIAALSAAGDRAIGSSDVAGADTDNEGPGSDSAQMKKDADKDDSDSDTSDDDLAAEFEEDMMGGSEANQLVAAQVGGNEREGGLGQLRAVTQNQDLTKDARDLAAFKKQREEERAAQQGLQSAGNEPNRMPGGGAGFPLDRKVIRRRITKTHPDGRQTITFKFILHPQEVKNIVSRLESTGEGSATQAKEFKYEHGEDENPPGHAMFEDEDDFEYSSKGRQLKGERRRGNIKMRRGAAGRVTPRGGAGGSNVARNLTLGKLKTKVSKEDRMKKRKREEEELEVYSINAKRKGTSNRRERGSIRDRRPHVIFAEKLEQIRNAVEARPYAGPFVKPVNRRLIPRYYEVISHPIDLSAIRDKIKRYEYRTADALVKDFELMKNNAVKFNGAQNQIAEEAVEIYKFVKDQVEASRSEFSPLEEEVEELMSGKANKQHLKANKKKGKGSKTKKTSSSSTTSGVSTSTGGSGLVGGINIGDIAQSMMDDDGDGTDTDDDILGDFDL